MHWKASAYSTSRPLDLSTLMQGPQSAALLHSLGADVIKVELPVFSEIFRVRPTAEWCDRLSVEEQRFSSVRTHDEWGSIMIEQGQHTEEVLLEHG